MTSTVPSQRSDSPRDDAGLFRSFRTAMDSRAGHYRADGSINVSAYWRRKFDIDPKLVTPFRVDRLLDRGGEQMMQDRDYARLWRAISDAIYVERHLRRRDSWMADECRLIGLHQTRVWLRREMAKEQRRLAA